MVMNVASLVLAQTSRSNILGLQRDLVDASREVATGFQSDVADSLRAGLSVSLSLRAEFSRLEQQQANIEFFQQRANITQQVLTDVSGSITDLAALLAPAGADPDSPQDGLLAGTALDTLNRVISSLNTGFAGDFLFSGTTTNILPFQSPQVGNSAAGGNSPFSIVEQQLNGFIADLEAAAGVGPGYVFGSAYEVERLIQGDAFFSNGGAAPSAAGLEGFNAIFNDTSQNADRLYSNAFYNGRESARAADVLLEIEQSEAGLLGATAPITGLLDTSGDGAVTTADGAAATFPPLDSSPTARKFAMDTDNIQYVRDILLARGFIEGVDFVVNGGLTEIDVDLNAEAARLTTRLNDTEVLEYGIDGAEQAFRDIMQGLYMLSVYDLSLFTNPDGTTNDAARQRYLLGEAASPAGILDAIGTIDPALDTNGDGRLRLDDAGVAEVGADVLTFDIDTGGGANAAAIAAQLRALGFIEGDTGAGLGDLPPGSPGVPAGGVRADFEAQDVSFVRNPDGTGATANLIRVSVRAEAAPEGTGLDLANSISSPLPGALGFLERGLDALLNLQTTLGSRQVQVQDELDTNILRQDLINTTILRVEGVDQAEAATRLNLLEAQLEATFAITSRLQSLSLSDFL